LVVVSGGPFGSWLLGKFFDAARRRLGSGLLGSELERALLAAGEAAVARTARELRRGASDDDVEQLAAVLDQVFRVPIPPPPLRGQPTILQPLETGIAAQLAVLGDAGLTGTGQSSAQALGLGVEEITQALVRNVVREVLARGASGGPLAPLADQLNHDLTRLQGQHTAGMLARIVEELVWVTRQSTTVAQPIPREFPRPIADFTGRRDELATLRGLLGSGPGDSASAVQPIVISAIDGMGGIGKSALAIVVAHELVDAGGFPDGQLYVNLQGATPGLAPLDPLEGLGQMLRALGVEPAQIPAKAEEAAARFRSLAAGRRLLVLLDNASGPEQVRPLLPASPTCGVLITSRQVLATLEGTRPLHLDVLLHDEALELLGRIAGPERITADLNTAAEVVRLCGYLPLAIRIAGARLLARPGWDVGVLAERLADATGRLEELQAGELAVRASFDFSLDALEHSGDSIDRAASAAFGLLSLPDGPDLDLTAAARLLDQPEASTQKLLERLVDAQLLDTPRKDRYQFHDLVRLYAREQALSQHPEAERMGALTRLLGFYSATAWHTLGLLRPGDRRLATADPRWTGGSVRFPDTSTASEWLEAERGNLVAAISQAAAAAPAIPTELPCQLTRALFGFFIVRGYWQDGVQANQIALELARRAHDLVAQAHAYNDLGVGYKELGRYAEAIACHEDSLTILRELGDRYGEAANLVNLGNVYERLGRYEEAIACQQDSLTILRELGDRYGEAIGLNNLGNAYQWLGRYEEAIACQQDSLTICQVLGDRDGEALTLGNLGAAYEALGRHEEAIACQQESLTLCRELGDRRGEANSLKNLGVVYLQQGRYEEAISCQQDSLTIFRELGDRHGEAESLRDLGDALRAVGRYLQAGVAWQEALAICEALQIPEADEIRDRLAALPTQVPEPPPGNE
jgi:tetratricopeptide (TPR) repeat protein